MRPVHDLRCMGRAGAFFFWKAVSLITLCREGPYWPESRHRAREKFKSCWRHDIAYPQGELAASYAPVAVLAVGECISTQSALHADKPLLESVGIMIMDIFKLALPVPAKLRP